MDDKQLQDMKLVEDLSKLVYVKPELIEQTGWNSKKITTLFNTVSNAELLKKHYFALSAFSFLMTGITSAFATHTPITNNNLLFFGAAALSMAATAFFAGASLHFATRRHSVEQEINQAVLNNVAKKEPTPPGPE